MSLLRDLLAIPVLFVQCVLALVFKPVLDCPIGAVVIALGVVFVWAFVTFVPDMLMLFFGIFSGVSGA